MGKKFLIIIGIIAAIVVLFVVIKKKTKSYVKYFISMANYNNYEEYRDAVEAKAREAKADGVLPPVADGWTDEQQIKSIHKMADWLYDHAVNYKNKKTINTPEEMIDWGVTDVIYNANKPVDPTPYSFPAKGLDEATLKKQMVNNGVYAFLAKNAEEALTVYKS